MRLWTIQTVEAWKQLQATGILRTDPKYINFDFSEAYKWLSTQMRFRIGSPPPQVDYPIWAWHQWRDAAHKKPDLRFFRHRNLAEEEVRLEIEIKDELVLLSDFALWHYVLNNWYLPTSEEDSENFDEELEVAGYLFDTKNKLLTPALEARIIDSWQRIFDLDWEDEYVTHKKFNKVIQATFWELPLDAVKKVDYLNKPNKVNKNVASEFNANYLATP